MMNWTDAAGRQYLETFPEGNPTTWANDMVTAFRKNHIDFETALLTLQRYLHTSCPPEHLQTIIEAIQAVNEQEKRNDRVRAIAYNEKHK
jgi:hypothetical protein